MYCNAFRKKQTFSKPFDNNLALPQNSQHEFYALAENSLSKRSLRPALAIILFESFFRATRILNQTLQLSHPGKPPVRESMTLSVKGFALLAFLFKII